MPTSRHPLLRVLIDRLRDTSGFGLIELMIALSILAIGTVALTGVFVASHLSLRRASQSDAAAVLSDRLLERFRAETWDNIALNSTQVAAAISATSDPYPSDTTLTDPYLPTSPNNLRQDITEANAPLAFDGTPAATACTNSPEPLTCYPTQTQTGPDGKSYRIDTYVTWGCPNETAQTLGGAMNAPVCTDTSSGHALPNAAVKVVTIVVRDGSISSLPVVYRSSTNFDRLGGGSMPTVTAIPAGSGSTGTTTTTSTVTGAPNPPSAVTFVNGVGSGSPCPCITLNNEHVPPGLSFDVAFPSTSLASDAFTLTLTDSNPADTVTYKGTAPQGAGIVHITNLDDGGKLVDGTITVSAFASNTAYGDSSAVVSTVIRDTTPPAGVSISSPTAGQTGFSVSGPFTGTGGFAFTSGDSPTVTVQFCQAATWTCGSSPTQTATANVGSTGNWSLSVSGSSKLSNNKNYTMRVVQSDAAGNTATSNTVSFHT
jgi:prepilin-type N-terminal cleavage/methylation domain-containing protein